MQPCKRRRAFVLLEGDRRRRDRRTATEWLRYPERRTGFDRRAPGTDRPLRRFADRGMRVLRREPWRLAALLALLAAMSWLDLAFTMEALAAGATEGNPVMASLFSVDVRLAAAVKLGVTGAVIAVVWRLRGYRRVLEATLLIVFGMLALMGYHVVLRALMA